MIIPLTRRRTHRERSQLYMVELEKEVLRLRDFQNVAAGKIKNLEHRVDILTRTLQDNRFVMPPLDEVAADYINIEAGPVLLSGSDSAMTGIPSDHLKHDLPVSLEYASSEAVPYVLHPQVGIDFVLA